MKMKFIVASLSLLVSMFSFVLLLWHMEPRGATANDRRVNAASLETKESQSTSAAEQTKSQELSPELADFEARCHAGGVLVCEGFDSAASFVAAKWRGSGLYPAADGQLRGVRDSAIKASGSGSLRFEIPSHSPANASGYWRQSFGQSFGEGMTFYVQFRQRFSKEMLKNNWGETTWKQAIFHNGASTCGQVELTTVQYYSDGFPMMYTDCGARMIATNEGRPPYLLQQGSYNCWYGQYNAKSCFMYPADRWVTFYYRVSIGRWDKPDSAIEAWVAMDGQPYKQWINMHKFTLKNDTPKQDYDTVTLLTYMTNKSTSVDHPAAYTWYDELIVASKPIAAPSTGAPVSIR